MATFDEVQVEQLLKPLNPNRVRIREEKFAYLSQEGQRAHMIRMFGFGNFDVETLDVREMFSDYSDTMISGGRDAPRKPGWSVGVLVTMRVTIRDRDGQHVCVYSESAVGTSTQGQRGEALDMATKSAASDAFKRCLINLGDQFGLALYNPKANIQYDNRKRIVGVKPVVMGLLKQVGEVEVGQTPIIDVTDLVESSDPDDEDKARAGV